MPLFSQSPTEHAVQWKSLQRLGLTRQIRSYQEYSFHALVGKVITDGYLNTLDINRVDTKEIMKAHYLMFEQIHPWAGKFRSLGEVATFSGYVAANPSRISRELDMLTHQFHEIMEKGEASFFHAAAFYHFRFERIHPFKDGNGRLGRSIAEMQLNKLVGRDSEKIIESSLYFNALKTTSQKNLTPLAQLFANAFAEPISNLAVPSPYRLAPFEVAWSDTDSLSLVEDIERSIIA